MNNDLISRQAATEALTEAYENIDAEFILEKLPSAQQWIPVSERLPEIGKNVLISGGDNNVGEGCYQSDGIWCQFRWSVKILENVKAWMPLPEPYKEDKQ